MQLYLGDCLDVLRTLADNSVDSVVTDPPYGLEFMGRKWDYDVPSVEIWAECLRVLKPGGHLLAFAGTRTQHRMCVRIEDAGFEVRDMIAWVYGSGFPKSLDVSKAIDKANGAEGRKGKVTGASGSKRNSMAGDFAGGEYHEYLPETDEAIAWEGWGTALKPALEPITLARKPLIGTVAENVLVHGTGGLNIDGCRVEGESTRRNNTAEMGYHGGNLADFYQTGSDAGRWPANLIHDGSDQVLAAFPSAPDQQAPESFTAPSSKTGSIDGARGRRKGGFGNVGAEKGDRLPNGPRYSDSGSAARFFYCAKASRKDRNEGCEAIAPQTTSDGPAVTADNAYQRGATERANSHPTVKPTDLMRYLCRLVTPPGGIVLDPFAGSGSTGKGALLEGFQFIGIERELEYWLIAHARLAAIDTSVSTG